MTTPRKVRAELVELGSCCGCGIDTGVTNITMLPYKAPEPGTGWGCAICDLAPDGAVAVLCHQCALMSLDPREVCAGYPYEGRRTPLGQVQALGPHEHDRAVHVTADEG